MYIPRHYPSAESRAAFLFVVMASFSLGCVKESKTLVKSRTPDVEKTASAVGRTSSDDTTLTITDATVTIPGGAFSSPADVSLTAVNGSDFLDDADLAAPASVEAGAVKMSSAAVGSSKLAEPQDALSVKLNVPLSKVFTSDTVAIILVTDATGKQVSYYIANEDLEFSTDQSSSTRYLDIPKITSGNFALALVSGIPKSILKEKFEVFPADGKVNVSTVEAVSVPVHAATSLSFTDIDAQGLQVQGSVTITAASNESDVTHYVLYWGSNSTTKQSTTPIATIAATGKDLSYTFAANTPIPTSPAATHLLVFTKNAKGEMTAGVSYLIIDLGVPTHAAVSLSFTDGDLDGGQISGNVTISKSSDETDVTDYVLYWGSSSSEKNSATPIVTLPVTGANVTHTFVANTSIPSGATHLLVYTKNAEGEMATGVNLTIVDKGVPTHAATSITFTDTDLDGGQLAGTVTINKSVNATDVTHYVLYWGSDASTKQDATPIATIATATNVTYNFSANTSIPTGPTATHLLVFTKNADGEMATGVALAIVDKGVPVNAAVSVSFTDTDLDGGQIGGTVTITNAITETDITDYVLYWGSNSTTKQSATPIATIPVAGSVTHTFTANTSLPSSPAATHLLVFTKNADGEMAAGVNTPIVDLGVPTHAAVSVAFTDTDLDGGQIAGNVTITKATDESDVTAYVLYWGSSTAAKQNATAIAEVPAAGSNVSYNISADTAIPTGPAATHLLVFTKNADGEMATGRYVAITDKGVPVHTAASVAFTDTDTDGGQIAGTVTITNAADESDVTDYLLYWGSDATTLQSATPIATIAKAPGAPVTHVFSANTSIPQTPAATHLIVRSKNADGEMATGVSVAITDKGVPVHDAGGISFTDSDVDSGQIAGTVSITKATDETDVTAYVLYWGSDASTKQNATPITTITKTGSDLTTAIAANTTIPTGPPAATHLLVYTKNADGEMATGKAVAITDTVGGGCGPVTISTCSCLPNAYDVVVSGYTGAQAVLNGTYSVTWSGMSGPMGKWTYDSGATGYVGYDADATYFEVYTSVSGQSSNAGPDFFDSLVNATCQEMIDGLSHYSGRVVITPK